MSTITASKEAFKTLPQSSNSSRPQQSTQQARAIGSSSDERGTRDHNVPPVITQSHHYASSRSSIQLWRTPEEVCYTLNRWSQASGELCCLRLHASSGATHRLRIDGRLYSWKEESLHDQMSNVGLQSSALNTRRVLCAHYFTAIMRLVAAAVARPV
ncbi:hypothetical protein AMS68_003744 [Peltaster fructicola]|uniref:Uncharacterized protein n=1 Tax=Peltaster fructicola TaxID=286661 RepID=A0A6H0XTX8_9PEZI|nr:hypothetical protein AMS68_003744 [Peltaster fructicola]